MAKFGKGALHVFLNNMVQEELLFAVTDEHRVHLPVHQQQMQPHSVCVPVCPNSMWLCQPSTKPKLIYLVTGRAFPFRLGMMLTTKALTTLESGQIELMSVHGMSCKSLEPLEYWGPFHFEHLFCILIYFLNAWYSAVSPPPSFQQHQHEANFDIKPRATCQKV